MEIQLHVMVQHRALCEASSLLRGWLHLLGKPVAAHTPACKLALSSDETKPMLLFLLRPGSSSCILHGSHREHTIV